MRRALRAAVAWAAPGWAWGVVGALWICGALSAEVPARARYTFGALGGKRQAVQSTHHVFYLASPGELRVVEKLPERVEREVKTPEPVGRLALEGVPEALTWLDERTLCVGCGTHLALVDAGEPKSPRLLREVAVADREVHGVSEMKRLGNHLYLAARAQGLLRLDLSGPDGPRKAGSLPLRGFATGLDLRGDLAVVATGVGLAVVRVSEESMRLESAVDTFRHAELVRLLGDRLAVCSKEHTVFFDISNPGKPVELGEVSNRDPFLHSHNAALHLGPTLAYVAATEGGLYIHDHSDPRAPRVVVQFGFRGNERRLTVDGRIRYLEALGLSGTREELARSLPVAENLRIPAVGMAVDGSRVYLADTEGKLWALEVDPGPPATARCVMRPE